jgi:GTPase
LETFERASTAPAQLFERPEGGDRAVLVHPDFGGVPPAEAMPEWEALAVSAGATVVERMVCRRARPEAGMLLGRGQVDRLRALVEADQADLVLVNHPLTASQERNLERRIGCRVIDRTGLILDIFAQRARSHEGKLQVELAQLRHLSSRLVRGWSHLERQKGGIGLRGPGETQLELDRRMLDVRIRQIESRLAKVGRQREQGRQARRRRDVPTVSLVGYTNAGKSTLFNALTAAQVYADDRLFATLDTTLRKLELGVHGPAVLADTVGFLRDLPHQLVAAFRSTLEEVAESSLLLHVIDASDPLREESIVEVERVLEAIGAGDIPRLRVYNKADRLLAPELLPEDPIVGSDQLCVSAVTGQGLEALKLAIGQRLGRERLHGVIRLQPHEGRLRARLFEFAQVCSETVGDDGQVLVEVDLLAADIGRFGADAGIRERLEPLAP